MLIGKPKAKILEIKSNIVVCPISDESIDFDNCRECLFLREHRSSGVTSEKGADGVIVCEYIKME